MKKKIADIVRELGKIRGNENIRSIRTYLCQIIDGKRPLNSEWELHLMKVLDCDTRLELTLIFPNIRFRDDEKFNGSYFSDSCNYEVSIVMTSPGIVPEKNIIDILHCLRVLEYYGIKTEIKMIKKELITN